MPVPREVSDSDRLRAALKILLEELGSVPAFTDIPDPELIARVDSCIERIRHKRDGLMVDPSLDMDIPF